MKIYIYIFILFILFKQTSVNNICGTVKYGFIDNGVSKDEKLKNKALHQLLEEFNKKSSNIEFTLEFNSLESLFYIDEQMESDLNPMTISFAKNIVSKGKYYCNIKEDLLLIDVTDKYEKNTLVKSKSSVTIWKLSKESKKIGNYTCYKATTIKTKVNNSGSYHFLIEAWYTPQIPVSFGPNEFNNLPGLILELKDSHYTLFAKSINITKDKTCKIKPLESTQILTLEQHEKNLEIRYNNFKDNIKK